MFGQGFTCPALLAFTAAGVSRTGLSPCAAGLSRPFRYARRRLRAAPLSLAATRGISVDFFSSGYLDVSVPPVRLPPLWIQGGILSTLRWVPPFGHRRVPGRLPPRRRFSQAAAPFFASHRLGIHRMRLFAWPYNPNRPGRRGLRAAFFAAGGAPPSPFPTTGRTARLPLLYFRLASLLCLSIPRAPPPRTAFAAPGRGARVCVSQIVKERAQGQCPRAASPGGLAARPAPPQGDPQARQTRRACGSPPL